MSPSLADELRGKRVGLALSAGFFGFFAHAGLMGALEQVGLGPAAVSGSSAGAMIGALHGAGLDAAAMARILRDIRRDDFWDPVGLGDLVHKAPAVGLLRGDKFTDLMRRLLPVESFEACRIPVHLEAVNLTHGSLDILNSGALAPAVVASSAYPGLFMPVHLNGCHYLDGGLANKLPLTCMLDDVDVVLIHWLQSRSLQKPPAVGRGLKTLLGALVRGVAVARRENSRMQIRVALERGVPVYVIAPQGLARADPFHLERGMTALEQGRAYAAKALEAPAQAARLTPDLSVLA